MGCILDEIKKKRKKRHQKHIKALIITPSVPQKKSQRDKSNDTKKDYQ
jgi:hypothetical protein